MMVTYEHLKELLHYDPEMGLFTWKVSRGPIARPGVVAGSINKGGYHKINIGGRKYSTHRLAWLYVIGQWPDGEIDHVNCNPLDNRFANLREADRFGNTRNTKKRRDNTSGYKGVGRKKGRWVARIWAGGKRKHIGYFDTAEAAYAAYVAEADKQHGEFARFE